MLRAHVEYEEGECKPWKEQNLSDLLRMCQAYAAHLCECVCRRITLVI